MPAPQRIRCQVEAITAHGDHVYTVDLRPERRVPVFRPGQFLHLTLDPYDPSAFWPESRVFSIASAPAQRDRLSIVYAVQGRYTARMEKELGVGQAVWVKLPYGDFVIDGKTDVALLAGGTGISAFTAFLEALSPDFPHAVYLFYGARQPSLLIYAPLAERLAQAVPGFHRFYFVEHLPDGDSLPPHTAQGRLSVEAAWSHIANPDAATYYLSGPPLMLRSLTGDLRTRGLPPEAIRTDAWE